MERISIPKKDWRSGRNYQFMKLPKALLQDPKYRSMSDGAKLLYPVLLERMGLSVMNDWQDEKGEVFIKYANRNLCSEMNWSPGKVCRLLRELEGSNLIRRKKNGQGKADDIYVRPFSEFCDISEAVNSHSEHSGIPGMSSQEFPGWESNKTDIKETYNNKIYLSEDEEDEFSFIECIKFNIDYDILAEYKVDKAKLDELVTIMSDVCSGLEPTLRVGMEVYPRKKVIERFLSLDSEHIEYVIDKLEHNAEKIKNHRSYALALLFNAPTSMDSDIERLCRRDGLIPVKYKQ